MSHVWELGLVHRLGTRVVPRRDVLSQVIPVKTFLVIRTSPRGRACLRCMPILDVKSTRKTYIPIRMLLDDVRVPRCHIAWRGLLCGR